MSNMSYCRFQNTLEDLEDCYENIHDEIDEEESESEYQARKELIELCKRIVEETR